MNRSIRPLLSLTAAAVLLAGAASAQGYYDRPYRTRADPAWPSAYDYQYRDYPVAPAYGREEAPRDETQPAPPVDAPEPTPAPTYEPAPLAGGPPIDQGPAAPYSPSSRAYSAGQTIGDIVSQPARDIGVKKADIPPVLAAAEASPYALADAANCAQMAVALSELDEVLGADYTVERLSVENRNARIAEAGGRAVVNSIIPFRGIVREVTGAAAADRRYAAAVDAGIARRGFLRGLQTAQGCEPGAQARLNR